MKTRNGILRTAAILTALLISPAQGFTGIAFAQGVQAAASTISGTVLDAVGDPVPGVSVTDGAGHTATTASNGTYTLTISAGSYTVTAAKNGDPCPKTDTWKNPVTVPPSATGNDFTCPNYTIAGTVLDGASNPVPGVSVTDGAGHTATTAANGNYTLITWAGPYTITAAKNGDPCSKTGWATPVNVPPNTTGINFTCPNYTISGNAGVAGVTLSFNDGLPKTATSDGSGNYSFVVSYNWSGTVTPSLTGYFFSPASRTYSIVQEDQTVQNYIATIITCRIYLPLVIR